MEDHLLEALQRKVQAKDDLIKGMSPEDVAKKHSISVRSAYRYLIEIQNDKTIINPKKTKQIPHAHVKITVEMSYCDFCSFFKKFGNGI